MYVGRTCLLCFGIFLAICEKFSKNRYSEQSADLVKQINFTFTCGTTYGTTSWSSL